MPRPRLEAFYEFEISHLMINRGWEHSPKKILGFFMERAQSDSAYRDYPASRTIGKYMERVRQGSVALIKERKEFEYPIHMGSGDDRIPWELTRYALDCLNFYTVNYGMRPCIGLTKRFASVAAASQDPTPMPDQQRAIFAEKFWYADLIGATASRNRPSTVRDELTLATKAWTASNAQFVPNLAAQLGVTEEWVMPKNDFGFLKYMPEFAKTFKTSPLYDEKLLKSDVLDEMDASQSEDETETRTVYLQ